MNSVVDFEAKRLENETEAEFVKLLDKEASNPQNVQPLSRSLFERMERLAKKIEAAEAAEQLQN